VNVLKFDPSSELMFRIRLTQKYLEEALNMARNARAILRRLGVKVSSGEGAV